MTIRPFGPLALIFDKASSLEILLASSNDATEGKNVCFGSAFTESDDDDGDSLGELFLVVAGSCFFGSSFLVGSCFLAGSPFELDLISGNSNVAKSSPGSAIIAIASPTGTSFEPSALIILAKIPSS